MDALIGHTGFVGGTLATAHGFAAHFNSTSIEAIQGRRFHTLVMAGAQGKKWWANQNPAADRAGIARSLAALAHVRAENAVLISTVDVLPVITGADEEFDAAGQPNHAYGTHRLWLETEMARLFPSLTILRLPGLHGRGLRKNILFDLAHNNQVDRIDPGGVFQFYDLQRLWADIATVRQAGLRLVHLVPAPVSVRAIVDRLFPASQLGPASANPPRYDVRTRHAALFGGSDGYIYDADAVMVRISTWMACGR